MTVLESLYCGFGVPLVLDPCLLPLNLENSQFTLDAPVARTALAWRAAAGRRPWSASRFGEFLLVALASGID